ncbi:MAG: response regulator [Xanthomonadales bacterium]|nr:response regulator [Xanthomonadales bacterium]
MNAIIGYSEMLQEEAEDDGLDEYIEDLKRIHTSGRYLLKLINDVLDLSKIEAEKVELDPEVIGIEGLMEDIKATVRPLVADKDNKFELKIESKIGEIYVDATKLRQIILNLLSNAAKFTEAGTVEAIVSRERSTPFDILAIDVRDSGIGMTDAQIEKVFDPFSQADASTTRNYGGTGLGLSISRRFCELMGGSLTCTSEKGVGSTFSIRIPIHPPPQTSGVFKVPKHLKEKYEKDFEDDDEPVDEPPPTETAVLEVPEHLREPEQDQKREGSTPRTVLVIDDDEPILDLVKRMLEPEGYRVLTANNAEDGLRLAREAKPMVITLDVVMPEVDGWSVLKALKADPELADIPVIMQTIVDEPLKGFAMGVADYLSKPIDRQRLVAAVARLRAKADRAVLVVEDDDNNRDLIAQWLKGDGWEVYTAADGLEGLDLYERCRPINLVLDLAMPNMDGFELLDTLRKKYPDDDLQVIVVTAKDLTAADRDRLAGSVMRIVQKGEGSMNEVLEQVRRTAMTSPV